MNPLSRTQAWHVPLPLDVAVMKRAAKALVGERITNSREYERLFNR